MRIGIDARFYGSRARGLGRYTQKLIEYLEKIDQENEYCIFLSPEGMRSYAPSGKNFFKREADCGWYSIREQYLMPKLIRKEKLDFVHFPHFNVPLLYRGKFVVTIHDLIITHYPTIRASTLHPLKYYIKHLGYQIVIRNAVRRASQIITVSEFSKKEILTYFHIPSSKVSVTYESVEKNAKIRESVSDQALKKNFGISGHYALYVGTAYPHKNLERLVQAWKTVHAQNKELKLVLVGRMDYFYKRLHDEIRVQKLEKEIILTGEVGEGDLQRLYEGAIVYVFPSLCEGFGLPALEAMERGIPVLVSSIECLQEVLGDSARYFDPNDSDDIAHAIIGMVNNKNLRKDYMEKGKRQVGYYSWRKMAEKTHVIYETITKREF